MPTITLKKAEARLVQLAYAERERYVNLSKDFKKQSDEASGRGEAIVSQALVDILEDRGLEAAPGTFIKSVPSEDGKAVTLEWDAPAESKPIETEAKDSDIKPEFKVLEPVS